MLDTDEHYLVEKQSDPYRNCIIRDHSDDDSLIDEDSYPYVLDNNKLPMGKRNQVKKGNKASLRAQQKNVVDVVPEFGSHEDNEPDILKLEDAYVMVMGVLTKMETFLKSDTTDFYELRLKNQVSVLKRTLLENSRTFGLHGVTSIGDLFPGYIPEEDTSNNNNTLNLAATNRTEKQPQQRTKEPKSRKTTRRSAHMIVQENIDEFDEIPVNNKRKSVTFKEETKRKQTSMEKQANNDEFLEAIEALKQQELEDVNKLLQRKPTEDERHLRRSSRPHIKPMKFWIREKLVQNLDGSYHMKVRSKNVSPTVFLVQNERTRSKSVGDKKKKDPNARMKPESVIKQSMKKDTDVVRNQIRKKFNNSAPALSQTKYSKGRRTLYSETLTQDLLPVYSVEASSSSQT